MIHKFVKPQQETDKGDVLNELRKNVKLTGCYSAARYQITRECAPSVELDLYVWDLTFTRRQR